MTIISNEYLSGSPFDCKECGAKSNALNHNKIVLNIKSLYLFIEKLKKRLKEWEPVILAAELIPHKSGFVEIADAYEAISKENIPKREFK